MYRTNLFATIPSDVIGIYQCKTASYSRGSRRVLHLRSSGADNYQIELKHMNSRSRVGAQISAWHNFAVERKEQL